MTEKTVSEIRVNGKVWKNINSLYWGATDTKYIVEAPKALEEYTWTEINEIACNGLASVKFKVGDTKTITMNTGEKITVRIIGFDHDTSYSSGGKAKITFETVDLVKVSSSSYVTNFATSSSYSYVNSNINNLFNKGSSWGGNNGGYIYSNLPSELKDLLVRVRKYYKSSITEWSPSSATNFYMFILSESEMFGTTEYIVNSTGDQYQYYVNNNNAQARIKKADGVATKYWLRDIAYQTRFSESDYTSPVTRVSAYGYLGLEESTILDYKGCGVSFAFCIGDEPEATKTPLDAPVITISNGVISWNAISNARNYSIYLNGTHYMYTNKTSVDLDQNVTTAGTYTVQVKANGSGSYSSSELSNSVSYTKADTSFTVTFRRADTEEFAKGFCVDIHCGTSSIRFGENDYDDAKSITIPSSGTPIEVTFEGVSGSSYTQAHYVVDSTSGYKEVGSYKTITIYGSADEIIDISYTGNS